ncbi:CDGSH iron-sulfur domain-containing protein [uncultured Jatrophihabitans sp.]|uniref:CDGSH iron-sulfur domain-containing protein n=1 Tax=uncultured Jatrophihabitans sp. TaxID=1610747 RepID=UPI0035CC8040
MGKRGTKGDRADATVTVYPDGPLIVRGDVEIRTVEGRTVERSGSPIALCRCGRSAVKPYCDGSHQNARLAATRATE